jgi:hypothetical protein
MSPATHHMSCVDARKTDADEFQKIQYIGSMTEAKNCLNIVMIMQFNTNSNRSTY